MSQFICEEIRPNAEPMNIVYQAINSVNGKRYIGMTTRGLHCRRRGHVSHSRIKNVTSYFSRAVLKYGIDEFQFSVLEICADQRTALDREREIIAERKPEYNIAAGGCTGPQGWKHSEESRRKLSESHIGKPGPWRGKKRSPESMAKMAATRAAKGIKPMLGKRHSAATIAKIKATRQFLPPLPAPTPEVLAIRLNNMKLANEKRMRSVICLSDGRQFANPNEAAEFYGVSSSALRRWCEGVSKCQRGLIFEYVK